MSETESDVKKEVKHVSEENPENEIDGKVKDYGIQKEANDAKDAGKNQKELDLEKQESTDSFEEIDSNETKEINKFPKPEGLKKEEVSGLKEFKKEEDSESEEFKKEEVSESEQFKKEEVSDSRKLKREEDSDSRELKKEEDSGLKELKKEEDSESKELKKEEDSGLKELKKEEDSESEEPRKEEDSDEVRSTDETISSSSEDSESSNGTLDDLDSNETKELNEFPKAEEMKKEEDSDSEDDEIKSAKKSESSELDRTSEKINSNKTTVSNEVPKFQKTPDSDSDSTVKTPKEKSKYFEESESVKIENEIVSVTPFNSPEGNPAMIQVTSVVGSSLIFAKKNKKDSEGSDDEEPKAVDRTKSPRNSFRQIKKKRRQTTTISRPQDIQIIVSDHSENKNLNNPPKPPRMKKTNNFFSENSNFSKSEILKNSEAGPEDFLEIPIDVPDKENRRIAFDLTDPEDNVSSKSSFKKIEDEEEEKFYEKSKLEKFLNYVLCRTDLVDAKLSEKPVKFWDLFKYGNRTDMIMVILALCLAALCGICQPLFAILSGRLANTLLLSDTDDSEFFVQGTQTVILFVIIGAALCVLAFAQFCCFNIACTRITRRIRNAYLKSILRQNAAWFEKNHSGALNTKLNDNIERIYEGIGDKLGLLTRNGVQYITGIIVALITNWQMTLPLLLFSPLIAFLMSISSRKISKASKKEMAVYAGAGCIAEEAITAYRTVAAFNAQEVEVRRYHDELTKGLKAGLRKGIYSGCLTGALIMLVMIFMGSALLWGTFLYSIGVVETPGEVFVVLMAIMSGAYHLGNASPHLMVLLTARVAASTVYKTIERIPKIDPYSTNGRKIYDLQGKIGFKNVSFRYPTRPDQKVLKNFSFTVNPGQTVALVGASGSGKSTVVGILNRLYEFEHGTVTIDGIDIRDLNVRWLRTVIGTVQQEPIIFNDTVESNIKRGNSTLTEKNMVEACKMANAHEFIENLPEGYSTRIGDGGVQLSGGQKQRIAIARTLARNPRILLLDEATSALDTHSEVLVQSALNNAAKNRTTIVIAHRLSTIRDADRIIVMNKGRFVESGTHNELLRRKGTYARLVKAQELDMTGDKDTSDDLEDGSPEELLSPDGTVPKESLNTLSIQKEVRESVRQSFQRDFMPSEHLGDPEQQELEMELTKEGIKPASFAQIFLDNRDLWPHIALALVICLFNAMAMPVNALLYGKSFEMFKDGRKDNVGDAAFFFIFFIALGIIAFIASTTTMYLFGKIGETVTMNMRIKVFRSIIYQDGSYFDNPAHTPGKLISRLATDTPNVKAAMDTRMGRVTQGLLSLITAIIISLFIDWPYALACSVIFVFLGSFQFFIAKMAHSKAVKFAESDEAGRTALEAIENVRTIQLLTAEFEIQEKFCETGLKRQKSEILKVPIEALNFATTHGLQYFTLAFSYMIGFVFVTNGFIDKISLFQVAQTMYFGAISVMQATEFFPEFVKSRLAASLMYNIINREPKTGRSDLGEKISMEGNVAFQGVYFAYPMRPKHAVMKGISLQTRPGQTVALVGPSGSGKSTVIALLERLYDPSLGTITIDGKDLKTLCLDDVRRQMCLVEQQPRLFSGTIKENIAYGLDLDKTSMDDIVEAARIANASSFISTLPLGYDTPLGEKGTQLSGGQKQRIAIARAMIRKPKILLLDEATSALDSTAEKAVQEALDKARQGRTCITIAHRLSSIQNSDQIIFVENGKVRERGNHVQLLQLKGKYYNLIQKQHLGVQ